ncbi:MAG TPA: outer membrane protein transport protein [Kofleriaceae bacterium]|nr:outer membrane protein transport protein [Kofleriaceae bacterium]
MKLRNFGISLVAPLALGAATATTAMAGGLNLPGTGPISTARAGAAVASTDDGEAVSINPAGLANVTGTRITLGSSFISHSQSFTRFGTYDAVPGQNVPWAGQAYATVTDESKPDIGFGNFQAVPMLVVTSDFGGKLGKLRGALGVFAPSGYPTRSMGADYKIDDPNTPPPPNRYDILSQKAAVILPSLAVAYPILPNLRVGGRFSWGIAQLEARQFVWGILNYEEWVGHDTDFTLKVKDNFVPTGSIGVQYEPTPNIELGAQYTMETSISASGDALSTPSAQLDLGGVPLTISATPDDEARCGKGGTATVQRGCVELALPMAASIGGRYKFLDQHSKFRGDVELNVHWENWGAPRAHDFRVVVDTRINDTLDLKDAYVKHGFRDTVAVRLAGSYVIPVANNSITVRAGASYDTAAAKAGWERSDFDGAARTTLAAGASYTMPRVRFDLGLGGVLEGTRTVGTDCNPTLQSPGCNGVETPTVDRAGWDPVNPLIVTNQQVENPVNHGTYKSGYFMFMLGVSTWF